MEQDLGYLDLVRSIAQLAQGDRVRLLRHFLKPEWQGDLVEAISADEKLRDLVTVKFAASPGWDQMRAERAAALRTASAYQKDNDSLREQMAKTNAAARDLGFAGGAEDAMRQLFERMHNWRDVAQRARREAEHYTTLVDHLTDLLGPEVSEAGAVQDGAGLSDLPKRIQARLERAAASIASAREERDIIRCDMAKEVERMMKERDEARNKYADRDEELQQIDDEVDRLGFSRELGPVEALRTLVRQRDSWMESAHQELRNSDFYRKLLDSVAELLGQEVYLSDDGSVQDSPIRPKLPELVKARLDEAAAERAAHARAVERLTSDLQAAWESSRLEQVGRIAALGDVKHLTEQRASLTREIAKLNEDLREERESSRLARVVHDEAMEELRTEHEKRVRRLSDPPTWGPVLAALREQHQLPATYSFPENQDDFVRVVECLIRHPARATTSVPDPQTLRWVVSYIRKDFTFHSTFGTRNAAYLAAMDELMVQFTASAERVERGENPLPTSQLMADAPSSDVAPVPSNPPGRFDVAAAEAEARSHLGLGGGAGSDVGGALFAMAALVLEACAALRDGSADRPASAARFESNETIDGWGFEFLKWTLDQVASAAGCSGEANIDQILVRIRSLHSAVQVGVELWSLLDDISTLGDSMKPERTKYFEAVNRIADGRGRFGSSDGQQVSLNMSPLPGQGERAVLSALEEQLAGLQKKVRELDARTMGLCK